MTDKASKAKAGNDREAGKTVDLNEETIKALQSTEPGEGSKEAEKQMNEPAVLPAEELVSELPADGVVLGQAVTVPNTNETKAEDAPAVDTFAGQGGSFYLDPETGERKRVHQEVTNEKGKTVGYRPVL